MSRQRRKVTAFADLANAINAPLPPHGCRYIMDDGPPWKNCGKPQLPKSAYCAEHAARCSVRDHRP